jgi:hypothetical protein
MITSRFNPRYSECSTNRMLPPGSSEIAIIGQYCQDKKPGITSTIEQPGPYDPGCLLLNLYQGQPTSPNADTAHFFVSLVYPSCLCVLAPRQLLKITQPPSVSPRRRSARPRRSRLPPPERPRSHQSHPTGSRRRGRRAPSRLPPGPRPPIPARWR